MIDLNILRENPELAKSLKLEITGADLIAFGESIHQKATECAKPKEDEQYLTPAQLAEAVHVSLVTLWSWDKKGITRPLRIGNKKLYRQSDLEKIMK
jgi:hypothetical protein